MSAFTAVPALKGYNWPAPWTDQPQDLQVLCSMGPETVCWAPASARVALVRTRQVTQEYWREVSRGTSGQYGPLSHEELTRSFLDHHFTAPMLSKGQTAGVYYIGLGITVPKGTSNPSATGDNRVPPVGIHPFMLIESTAIRLTSFLRCAKVAAIANNVLAHTGDAPDVIKTNARLEWTTSQSSGTPKLPTDMKQALDAVNIPYDAAKNKILLANDFQVAVPVFCEKVVKIDEWYRVGTITFTEDLDLASMAKNLIDMDFLGDEEDLMPSEEEEWMMDYF